MTQSELDTLREKKSFLPRLDLVRDIFVFCCYTGLAYADVQQLKQEHIIIGVNGDRWIKMPRKKTKAISSIPLLSPAEEIIEKYSEHPYVLDGKGVLPVLTNQKSNAYLKEIADVCGINKNLSLEERDFLLFSVESLLSKVRKAKKTSIRSMRDCIYFFCKEGWALANPIYCCLRVPSGSECFAKKRPAFK